MKIVLDRQLSHRNIDNIAKTDFLFYEKTLNKGRLSILQSDQKLINE